MPTMPGASLNMWQHPHGWGRYTKLSPPLKDASLGSGHSLLTCLNWIQRPQGSLLQRPKGKLIISIIGRRKRGNFPLQNLGILMTEMVTALQKYLFGFTKAIRN